MADGSHDSAPELTDAPAGAHRQAVLKAIDVSAQSRGIDTSNSIDEFAVEQRLFQDAGALVPPYHPRTMWDLYEASSTLRQCVDAYKANIDGNGYHLEGVIDIDSDDVHERVASAMYLERLAAREAGQIVTTLTPTEQEVEAKIREIADAMKLEQFRVDSFFENVVSDRSFVGLRRETREDLEVTGNAYWEVLRDNRERVARFDHLPSATMRIMPLQRELIDVTIPVQTGPLSMGREKVRRRFRRYLQVIGVKKVYFKEYGDPRTMSSTTGRYYDNRLALEAAEKTAAIEATEVMHFRIPGPGAYGMPRWIGALLSVLGTRHAEEVNYLYFNNKGIPPLALLVSGATVSKDSVKRIEDYIENNLKGVKNFHKILIIEAESADSSDPDQLAPGRIRLELRPLTQAQQSDALFQKYDERNADKVGMQFRLPRLLRGDVRDFNRATAEAAIEFAEGQVFEPERTEFDDMINKRLLRSELGVVYWRFVSNSVQVRDPGRVAEMIERLTRAYALVPADGRQLAEELVFNRKLRKIDADWMYQPPMLTQVGIPADPNHDWSIPGLGGTSAPPGPTEPSGPGAKPAGAPASIKLGYGRRKMTDAELVHAARELVRLRAAFEQAEAEDELEELRTNKANDADESKPVPVAKAVETETITMPLDVIVDRFALITQPTTG